MHRAGDVAAGVLRVLPDVEDPLAEVGGVGEGRAPEREARPLPGPDAPGQLAPQLVVADLPALADQLGAVLPGVEDEDQGPVALDKPSEPRRELVAQGDGQRAGDVTGRPRRHGAGVDEDGAVVQLPPERRQVEGGEWRLGSAEDRRPGPVHLPQLPEVGRVGAEAGQEGGDEGLLVGSGEQRVAAPLLLDGRPAPVVGRRRAEAARPVGGEHRRVVGQGQELVVQGPPQGAGEGLGGLGGDQVGAGD